MFEYLRKKQMYRVLFDTFQPKVDESAFASGATYWKDFYGDIKEDIPPGIPYPLVQNSQITCFVDAKHAGKVVTWSSHAFVLIYLINAPIVWFSKKQNTVESSTFGS